MFIEGLPRSSFLRVVAKESLESTATPVVLAFAPNVNYNTHSTGQGTWWTHHRFAAGLRVIAREAYARRMHRMAVFKM